MQNTPYATGAPLYVDAGWRGVLPLPAGKKASPPVGFTGHGGAEPDIDTVIAWQAEAGAGNVALRLPDGVLGIDVDAYAGKDGAATLAILQRTLGELPATWTSTARADGVSGIRLYRVPRGLAWQERVMGRGSGIELIWHGHRYAVVWPSLHPGDRDQGIAGALAPGASYRWLTPEGAPLEIGVPGIESLTKLPAPWVERLSVSVDVQKLDTAQVSAQVDSEVFGLAPRSFTFGQAVEFCRPALLALEGARDGSINILLNDAAVMLGHFADAPGFWSSADAASWLLQALESTVYDGATWRAENTIRSGLAGGAASWRAVLEVPGPVMGSSQRAEVDAEAMGDAVERMRAELLDSDALDALPDPIPLVDGYLYRDTVGAVIGKSGDGKSHVMLDLAGAVGGGTAWHGREVPERVEVWCLVAEGASGMKRRVRAWEKHHGRRLVGVRFLPRPVQAGGPEWAVLVELARADRPGLIFLDTLARITVGMEENSNSEMGVLIDRMERLRLAAGGACVMAVHHLGHNGDQGRGASALKGAWTTELRVRKESRVGGGWTVVVETSKVKDGAEVEPLPLEMRVIGLGHDERGREIDSVVLVADALTEAGVGLASAPGGRWGELYAELPKSRLKLIDTLDNVYPTNGATKAELKRSCGAMVTKTFDRAWDDLIDREVLVRIEGTQRYKLAHLHAAQGAGESDDTA